MINEIYPRKLTQLTYITFTTFVSIVSYLEQTFFSRKYFDVFIFVGGYPDNCPPRKNASRLGLGFWSRLRLVLGLRGGGAGGGGAETRQLSPKKIVPQLGLWFGLDLVLGLGGNSPRGQLSKNPVGGFPFSQIFFFFICSNKSKFLRGESNIDFSMHKVIMTLGSGGEGVGGYHF